MAPILGSDGKELDLPTPWLGTTYLHGVMWNSACVRNGERCIQRIEQIFYLADQRIIDRDVRTRDKEGRLPLHVACLQNAPIQVISLLIDNYGVGLGVRDMRGCLPLHCLLANAHPRLDVVAFLVDFGGVAPLKIRNHQGDLPIHQLVQKRGVGGIVQLLINLYPESTQVRDGRGQLPLHTACSLSDLQVIRILIESYPDALQKRSDGNEGSIPLHLALSCSRPSQEILNVLINAWPQSVEATNSYGQCALHIACEQRDLPYRQYQAIMGMLLRRYPEGARVMDTNGNVPLFLAAENPQAPLDLTYVMVRAFPELIRGKKLKKRKRLWRRLSESFTEKRKRLWSFLESLTKLIAGCRSKGTQGSNLETSVTVSTISLESESS